MMRRRSPLRVAAAVSLFGALLLAGCNGPTFGRDRLGGRAADAVSMGAFNFPESRVLAEVYSQALRAAGVATTGISQLTGREGTVLALQSGDIDFLPEYNGNALDFATDVDVAQTDSEAITERLREILAEEGLVVLESSPAENRDELVVTAATAQEHRLRTVSDLEPVAGRLAVGGPVEFQERNTGLPGLRKVYGIEFGEYVRTDAGGPRTVEALLDGTIDVARLFSTDPLIEEHGLVVLEEDKPFSLPNAVTPIVREEVLTEEMAGVLNRVSAALTTEDLVQFNRRMIADDEPGTIARDFLDEHGLR